MTDYRKFFEKYGPHYPQCKYFNDAPSGGFWEELYQAFKQRLEVEAMERCKELFEDCDHLGQVAINRNGETICGDCGDVIVPKESGHE
jgi:hypothetical protein